MEQTNVKVIEPATVVVTETVVMPMPAVRAMTRRQVKQMRAAGYKLLAIAAEEDVSKFEDMLEWILTNVYADVDLDDFPNGDCMRLAGDTFRLAAGQPTEEAKNS